MNELKPLKLLSKTEHKFTDGTYKWLALCGCGKQFLTKKRNVELGQTKSCGCYRSMCSRARRILVENNRVLNEDVIIPNAFYRYQTAAKAKNLSFTLTYPEFEKMVTSPCYYSGSMPDKIIGIDRLNSDLGYEFNNCVPCCSTCNYFKASIDHDTFLALVKLIYNNVIKYE